MESSLCILNTADFWVIPWSVVELPCITLLKTAESSSLNDYQFPTGSEWNCVPNALFHDEMIFDLSLHRPVHASTATWSSYLWSPWFLWNILFLCCYPPPLDSLYSVCSCILLNPSPTMMLQPWEEGRDINVSLRAEHFTDLWGKSLC